MIDRSIMRRRSRRYQVSQSTVSYLLITSKQSWLTYLHSGMLEQVAILERTLTDKSNNLKSQEIHVKRLDDMIGSLRTDCAHWERKSSSASKELARLHTNHQAQMMAQQTDLKEKYSAIKIKLKVTLNRLFMKVILTKTTVCLRWSVCPLIRHLCFVSRCIPNDCSCGKRRSNRF